MGLLPGGNGVSVAPPTRPISTPWRPICWIASSPWTRPTRCGSRTSTYIWTQEGWLYLAAILDLYSRKVVGWAVDESLERHLALDALAMALSNRRPARGLLHHSDRGVQYASDDYQKALKKDGLICSMSRKGDCWDNAMAESFFATLKAELVYLTEYRTRAEARASLFEYIEVFYNRQRRHSAIGYVSPSQFEIAAFKRKMAA